jgi:hypothetical protein
MANFEFGGEPLTDISKFRFRLIVILFLFSRLSRGLVPQTVLFVIALDERLPVYLGYICILEHVTCTASDTLRNNIFFAVPRHNPEAQQPDFFWPALRKS